MKNQEIIRINTKGIYVTATEVESGRNAGFAGVTGILKEGNNNNLAWRGRLCHSGMESSYDIGSWISF